MDTKVSRSASILLCQLAAHGPSYRAELARKAKVSRTTASTLVKELLAAKLVQETLNQDVHNSSEDLLPKANRSQSSENEKLKTKLRVTTNSGVIGSIVCLHGTVGTALARIDGSIISKRVFSAGAAFGPQLLLEQGSKMIYEQLEENNLELSKLIAIHLAVDTQCDEKTGEVLGGEASANWMGINPKQWISNTFQVPVQIQNTARLQAFAEYLMGNGRGHNNVLYINVSYGVALGQVVDGQIMSGSHGGSGELGHLIYNWNGPRCSCGNNGCLQQYISIPALLKNAEAIAAVAEQPESFSELLALAHKNTEINELLSEAGRITGRALVNVAHLLDPDQIILGGEVASVGRLFTDPVTEELHSHTLPLIKSNLEVTSQDVAQNFEVLAISGIESMRRRAEFYPTVLKHLQLDESPVTLAAVSTLSQNAYVTH
ncbi:hypothetical protein BSR29_00860 [Boudabousia liubingyangii]|uniref:ROK family transcriptional regulator n=1 Tax=Boudabousia liubingyangii TaxID=1921764 RepID=A0A1Q5PPU5_9ACTO|nr:ROK family transcriptional regulator [Boudabousia liubingyangii]OKL49539.1 hypothetical protein BSR29_00860 [Boudabousia liubingyangii]